MRKLLGCAVLALGVGGLGVLATLRDAPRIQTMISSDIQTLVHTSPHDLWASVSGRDVLVSGVVAYASDVAALQSALGEVSGVRVVDMTGVEILPLADPFELIATREGETGMIISGAVPNARTRAALMGLSNGSETDLIESSGVPDGAWEQVAQIGVIRLRELNAGTFILSGRDITITGLAATPAERRAVTAVLDILPDGYTATIEIDVEDDGTPLRLIVDVDAAGNVVASGKLPADLPIAQILGDADTTDVVQAAFPSPDPDWPDVAGMALDSLSLLIDGRLGIEDRQITLTGSATPSGKADAEALMRNLPITFDVTTDIALWDDGQPLTMVMTWDGTTANAEGKLPTDFTLRGPAGVAVTNNSTASFFPDTQGDFTRNVTAGVAALGLLETGTLTASAQNITLAGTASTPQVNATLDAALMDIAEGTHVQRDISYADDGSPAAWTLTFDIASGARITGRLPSGFEIYQIAQALGLSAIAGTAGTARSDSDIGNTLDALRIVADHLPEVENMVYTRDADGSALNLIVSPGVDIDLMAADLVVRLPVDVAFSLAPLRDMPADGTQRRNSLTDLDEEFRAGFWMPIVDVTPDVAGCTQQSDAVQARTKITFLTDTARLDAASIRAINALAAVARPCLEAGLMLEIGGHTDAQGFAEENEALSLARATALRSALGARGIQLDAIIVRGFGMTQPIADNTTPEGRAANSRITLTWTAP